MVSKSCPCLRCVLQLYAQGGPKQLQQSWQEYFGSDSWQLELEVANAVAPGFQIKATDAVAASIWALVAHWGQATDAIVAGVHYGGDTDTIACMTGALLCVCVELMAASALVVAS